MSDTNPLLIGAQFLGLENDTKFQRQVLTDPYLQAAVTALGQTLERIPEVEVTASARSLMHVEAAERHPAARRSAAKNVSAPHLQNAFIDEARHSMGQPTLDDAQALIGRKVKLVFNAERPSGMTGATGMLTDVVQPAVGPAYVMLDNDTNLMFPLNSLQSIEAA